jgi:hypothetical protein
MAKASARPQATTNAMNGTIIRLVDVAAMIFVHRAELARQHNTAFSER